MINLYLVRHGECEGKGLYIGRGSDYSLVNEGKSQIQKIAATIKNKKLDTIISSPMIRAMESAHILSDITGVPVISVPGLEETDFGAWEGQSYDELMKLYPQDITRWIENPIVYSPPEGESLTDLNERVLKSLSHILSLKKGDKDRNILIVSHRGPIIILILNFLSLDLDKFWNFNVNRGSISKVNVYPRFNVLDYINLTAVP